MHQPEIDCEHIYFNGILSETVHGFQILTGKLLLCTIKMSINDHYRRSLIPNSKTNLQLSDYTRHYSTFHHF